MERIGLHSGVGRQPVPDARLAGLRQAEGGGSVPGQIDQEGAIGRRGGKEGQAGSDDGGAAAALHGPATGEHGIPHGTKGEPASIRARQPGLGEGGVP
jgi:hypothetical protein